MFVVLILPLLLFCTTLRAQSLLPQARAAAETHTIPLGCVYVDTCEAQLCGCLGNGAVLSSRVLVDPVTQTNVTRQVCQPGSNICQADSNCFRNYINCWDAALSRCPRSVLDFHCCTLATLSGCTPPVTQSHCASRCDGEVAAGCVQSLVPLSSLQSTCYAQASSNQGINCRFLADGPPYPAGSAACGRVAACQQDYYNCIGQSDLHTCTTPDLQGLCQLPEPIFGPAAQGTCAANEHLDAPCSTVTSRVQSRFSGDADEDDEPRESEKWLDAWGTILILATAAGSVLCLVCMPGLALYVFLRRQATPEVVTTVPTIAPVELSGLPAPLTP
eukprot:NODE_610_length_1328_cov_99.223980_g571_i0.p1 GENE.NODE_610_length_1328_cov_99.223980_g571_i0~~NODE_610_length_1328_cov_99.223980_g571_i0.p1  ORF type:complete len:331 (+),score=19.58 NODE_610_length_1328_cov_99.223980_g571_i0:319-1311(+)